MSIEIDKTDRKWVKSIIQRYPTGLENNMDFYGIPCIFTKVSYLLCTIAQCKETCASLYFYTVHKNYYAVTIEN